MRANQWKDNLGDEHSIRKTGKTKRPRFLSLRTRQTSDNCADDATPFRPKHFPLSEFICRVDFYSTLALDFWGHPQAGYAENKELGATGNAGEGRGNFTEPYFLSSLPYMT